MPFAVPVRVTEPAPLIGPARVRVEFVGAKVAPLAPTTTPRFASKETSAVDFSVAPEIETLAAVLTAGTAPKADSEATVSVPPLMKVLPVKVLATPRTSSPVPALTKLTAAPLSTTGTLRVKTPVPACCTMSSCAAAGVMDAPAATERRA